MQQDIENGRPHLCLFWQRKPILLFKSKHSIVGRETKEDNENWCWRMEMKWSKIEERGFGRLIDWLIGVQCNPAIRLDAFPAFGDRLRSCNYLLLGHLLVPSDLFFYPIWCSDAVPGAPTLLASNSLRDFICQISGGKRNTLINATLLINRAIIAFLPWPCGWWSKAKDELIKHA